MIKWFKDRHVSISQEDSQIASSVSVVNIDEVLCEQFESVYAEKERVHAASNLGWETNDWIYKEDLKQAHYEDDKSRFEEDMREEERLNEPVTITVPRSVAESLQTALKGELNLTL